MCIHRRVTQIGGNRIMRYYCNSYKLLKAIVTFCLVGASALGGSWEKGLLHCFDENTRPPTLEDISMIVQNSWIYAALISLPEGDSIIIMTSKVDRDKTCYGNCTDTCLICDDNIVFNRNKASIKPQLGMMVPGKPYILHDYHFEDFPQPDICLEYLFNDKMLAFRDCNETRPIKCMNDTIVFDTTACYQPSTLIPSCLPLPLEKNNHCNFTKDCTVAGLFQESNVYVFTLVGAAFIYGMINIIFIMCTVKYLLKKLTNRVSSQDQNSSPNRMEPKIQMYYTHL